MAKIIGRKDYIENNLLTSLLWSLTYLVDSSLLSHGWEGLYSIVFEQGLVGKPGFQNVVKRGKKFLLCRSSTSSIIREEAMPSMWGLVKKWSFPQGKAYTGKEE